MHDGILKLFSCVSNKSKCKYFKKPEQNEFGSDGERNGRPTDRNAGGAAAPTPKPLQQAAAASSREEQHTIPASQSKLPD